MISLKTQHTENHGSRRNHDISLPLPFTTISNYNIKLSMQKMPFAHTNKQAQPASL